MVKKTALILGATGLIGNQLLRQLCDDERWQKVRVVGRRRPDYPHAKIEFVQSELVDIPRLAADAFDVDVVFNCLGTTIKQAGSRRGFKSVDMDAVLAAAWLAKQQQVPVFVSVSAYGAKENSRVFYSRVKGMVEERLVSLQFPRLILLQPSLLLGDRKEFRFGEKLVDKSWNLLEPVFGRQLAAPWRPIEARAVARAMLNSALEDSSVAVERLRYQDIQQRQ